MGELDRPQVAEAALDPPWGPLEQPAAPVQVPHRDWRSQGEHRCRAVHLVPPAAAARQKIPMRR